MELREIEYFIAIAANSSLSIAAKELYISQSALSQFLIKLENQIGTPLFLRNNASLTLTKAGTIYYENALQIREIKRHTYKQIEDVKELRESRLHIGVAGSRSLHYVSEVLSELYPKYPDSEIHITEGFALRIVEKIKRNEIDFGVVSIINDPELEQIPFSNEEVIVMLPCDHPLAGLGKDNPFGELNKIDIHSLSSSQFVLLRKETVLRKLCDDYFEKNAFQPRIFAEGLNNISGLNLIEEGKAISLSTAYYGQFLKNVCFASLTQPFYYIDGLVYRKNAYLSKIMRDFLQLALENCKKY